MRTMEKYSIFYGLLIWRRKVLMVIKAPKENDFHGLAFGFGLRIGKHETLEFLIDFLLFVLRLPANYFRVFSFAFSERICILTQILWWHSSSLVIEMSNVCCVEAHEYAKSLISNDPIANHPDKYGRLFTAKTRSRLTNETNNLINRALLVLPRPQRDFDPRVVKSNSVFLCRRNAHAQPAAIRQATRIT